MKIVLIDTIPVDARNQGSINLGYEIVSKHLKADRRHWRNIIPWHKYDIIAFNVFYPTHVLNIAPFLKNNGIPIFASDRGGSKYPLLMAGGQGISNLNGCMDAIMDEIYQGEIDGEVEEKGWWRLPELQSDPIIKDGKAVIELTRGCKYRCSFCEYGWVHGGKFRAKDIDQVQEQIKFCKGRTNSINFLSANIGAYPFIDQLFDVCQENGVYILNSDMCLRDIDKCSPIVEKKKSVKVGLESFDEITRSAINKPLSTSNFESVIAGLTDKASMVHFYLIYGLPGDNYSKWYEGIKFLGDLRKKYSKNIRFEFSITNFEPCKGTPLESAPLVDFRAKEQFIEEWGNALYENGFVPDPVLEYKTHRGRLGRKENSYKLLMNLKQKDKAITEAIIYGFPRGVSRSIDDEDAANFNNLCDGEGIKKRLPQKGLAPFKVKRIRRK